MRLQLRKTEQGAAPSPSLDRAIKKALSNVKKASPSGKPRRIETRSVSLRRPLPYAGTNRIRFPGSALSLLSRTDRISPAHGPPSRRDKFCFFYATSAVAPCQAPSRLMHFVTGIHGISQNGRHFLLIGPRTMVFNAPSFATGI